LDEATDWAGGQFDVVDAAPRFAAVDQFGFGGVVDGLGERCRNHAARADRRGDPELG
jgi:hypothetical protein